LRLDYSSARSRKWHGRQQWRLGVPLRLDYSSARSRK